MRDVYIPDLTERFPEGFGGVDMCEPRDIEYEMMCAMEDAMDEEMEESQNSESE